MKNIHVVKWLVTFTLLAISFNSFNRSISPPTENTGAPSEGNCTGCHAGSAVSSGTNWNAISLNGLPANGYVPGTTYTLTVNGSSAATSKNGLLLTVLNSSNTNAGSLSAGTGNSVLVAARNYIGHTSSGTANSSFSFSWTAPSTGVGTVTFYLSWLATNSNGGTGGDITYVKSFNLIQVPPPTAVINASSNSVCVGDTIILQGSGLNNPTTYAWTMTGGSPTSASSQNTKVVYTTPGPKQIRLVTSNANGSSNPATLQVVINAKPVFSVTQSASHLCGNTDTVLLAATNVSGYSYLWMPGSITSSTAKITNTGAYTVKVTSSNNCSATSNVYSVSKRNLPVSTLTSDKDSSCVNDSIVLKANGTYNTYIFKKDNLVIQSSRDSVFKVASSGSYQMQVYDGFCYSAESVKSVFVQSILSAPSLYTNSSAVNQINFNWNKIANALAYQISLDSGNTWITQNDTFYTIKVTPQPQSKKIWVRATSNNLCPFGLISSIIGQNAKCIKPDISFNYLSKVCLNSLNDTTSFELLNNAALAQYYFTISNANFSSTKKQGGLFFIPVNNGINQIHLLGVDSTFINCSIDTFFSINASDFSIQKPAFNLNNTSVKNVCASAGEFELKTKPLLLADSIYFILKDAANIRNLVLNPSGFDSVFAISSFNNMGAISTVYVLQKNNSSGCVAVSDTGLIRFLPDIGLEISSSMNQNSKTIAFTSNSNSSLRNIYWDFGDNQTDSNDFNPIHTYINDGNYLVKALAIDLFNCTDTTSMNVQIGTTGFNSITGLSGIQFYPNPIQSNLNIEANSNSNKLYQIIIYDFTGKKVMNPFALQFVTGMNVFNLNLNGLAKGMYVLSIEADNASIKQVITKE